MTVKQKQDRQCEIITEADNMIHEVGIFRTKTVKHIKMHSNGDTNYVHKNEYRTTTDFSTKDFICNI